MKKKSFFTFLILSFLSCGGVADTLSKVNIIDTLNKVIENNPDLAASIDNQSAVEHELSRTKANFLPQIDIETSIGRDKQKIQGMGSKDLDQNEASITLRQNLFNGFETTNTTQNVQEKLNSAINRVASNAQTLGLEAIKAHIDVYTQSMILKNAQINVSKLQKIQTLIQNRADSGNSNQADLNQANARVNAAQSNVLSTLQNLSEAQARYERIVGVMPLNIDKPVSLADSLPFDIEAAFNVALINNPSLSASKFDELAAKANVEAAKAKFLPQVDVELTSSRSRNASITTPFETDNRARIVARYNIFSGGADFAQKRENLSRAHQAKNQVRATQADLEKEIEIAWNKYLHSKEKAPILENYAAHTEKVRELYFEQFNLGQRTLLDLLDSENELYQSQVELVTNESTEIFSTYQILAAMGVMLETLNISTPL